MSFPLRLARTFHALSDETRLRIMARLLSGERCVCDLMKMLAVAQSRLSFHMKILKDAGLVTDRREGRWIHYSIVPESLQDIRNVLNNVAEQAAGGRHGGCRDQGNRPGQIRRSGAARD